MTATDEGRKLAVEWLGSLARISAPSERHATEVAATEYLVLKAELAKAKADLGEIDRICADTRSDDGKLDLFCVVRAAAAIAAPYRIEADPLVEAAAMAGLDANDPRIAVIRAELAKRGVTLP